MDLLKGKISKLVLSTHVSGGKEGTSTSHVATFLIGSRPVRLTMPDSAIIAEGDELVVAGKSKHGVLDAVAYRNNTNGALGKGAVVLHAVIGGIFLLVGIATLFIFIGILFALIGIWGIRQAIYLSKAYAAVEHAV